MYPSQLRLLVAPLRRLRGRRLRLRRDSTRRLRRPRRERARLGINNAWAAQKEIPAGISPIHRVAMAPAQQRDNTGGG